jgi:hypothetical protein
VKIRFCQGQVTAAAASNNLNVLNLFLNEYALFPSSACARGALLGPIGLRV